jgi:threonine dehydratase
MRTVVSKSSEQVAGHSAAGTGGRTELLESVRYLGERFPAAGIRTVNVARAVDLDARVDATLHTRVWLALESMQVTGSFKVRGALAALGALVKRHPGERPRVVAASAGNHAAGVAYAAHVLGALATVVMPRSVPATKRQRVEAYGAEIVLADTDHYDDAEALAQRLARERGASFLSPYDDVDVVAGNGGSLGFEIARALGPFADLVVLAPFGGGGLATGLAWAFERVAHAEARVRVWGAQSEASPAMALSLERGEAVVRFVPEGPTLAEGLEGGISARAFERARAAIRGVLVVGEEDIAAAMVYAYREMGLVLEGSAATALAPVLVGLPPVVRAGSSPVSSAAHADLVVVLTGRNVDRGRLDEVLAGEPTHEEGA